MPANMPAAEVEITTSLVDSLLRSQRPDLAHLGVQPMAFGWDNVLFRVGDDLVARLPRREASKGLILNEARWLPLIATGLPLAIPVPLFLGEPDDGYPWNWALTSWVPGTPVALSAGLDLAAAAEDLGRFLQALHKPAPADAPENPYRGIPLRTRDESTRSRIEAFSSLVDSAEAQRVWAAAVAVPEFDGEPVWIHGDLHPNNLLCVEGTLSGVVDFGDITSGDPATDLAVAWMLFPPEMHERFRDAYGGVDGGTWERARGWALSLGTAYLAYSADNPAMGRIGTATMQRLLKQTTD